jgi:site-specific recombinase XerD
MDYEKYEKECDRIRQDNIQLLEKFDAWLEEKGLADDTIQKHVSNIEFYINYFLLYEEAIEAKDGALKIGIFLGYWFIRKAMWSSVQHIKNNAASLKKFYKFMLEKGQIEQEDLDDLHEIIKEEMPDWIDAMREFDNLGEQAMENFWDL